MDMEEVFREEDESPTASKPDDNEEECAVAEFSFIDLQRCFEWRCFLDFLQADVLVSHGVSDEALLQTRNNSSDGLPCAVAVVHNGEYALMFVTKSFEMLTGRDSAEVIEGCWTNALLPSDLSLNERVNREGIQEVEQFCAAAQDHHVTKAPIQPVTMRVFLLGGQSKERVYWLLLEITAVRFNSSLHLLFILRVLTMPSLEALEPSKTRSDAFSLFLTKLRAKLQKHADIRKTTVVARLLEEEAFAWLRSGRGEEHSLARRNSLTRQGTVCQKQELKGRYLLDFLSKCNESMQYAHSDFYNAHDHTDVSKVLGAAAATLGSRSRGSEYENVAWVVADTIADFPLVHVSKGFTQLTGYLGTHVLGKNCRFLQPLDRSKNEAINVKECKRLKDFCAARQVDSKITSLMLNQDANGHFFWNLLVLLQVNFDLKIYIVGTLTKLSSLSHELMSILTSFDGRSLALAESLRAVVQVRDGRLSPLPWHVESNESVLAECVLGWMQECGPDVPELWEGDHFAPPIGGLSAKLFGGGWHSLLEVVEACAAKLSPLQGHVVSKTTANMPGGISFCISDAYAYDFPLVFISKEFEQITGYDTDFALGRNCRFLLPNDERINSQLNGEEIQRAQAFFEASRQQDSFLSCDAAPLVSLFVYERRGGDRFWCLSSMYVGKAAGHLYIVAVQLPLPCVMPSLLATRLSSVIADDYDASSVNDFSISVSSFLSQLREQMRQCCVPVAVALISQLREQDTAKASQDMRTFAERSITKWTTQATDDFDGDLHVVKSGKPAVWIFEYGRRWDRLLSELAKNEATASLAGALLSDVSIPCAVTDAASADCPLVYMSRGLEELTGYSHEWALGRNCRFLQPKLASWNDAVNLHERRRIRKFSELPPKKSHITSLLLNETREGCIFLNLVVLRHVSVDGHPYILSMQNNLPKQLNLVSELLLGGIDGIERIHHLRNLIFEREASFPTEPLEFVVQVCTAQWMQDVPVSTIMRLSLTPPEVCKSSIPPVGVELTRQSDLHLALPAAIEEGVRHIVFNFTNCSGDALQAQLFHLKIVDVLGSLRKKCLHYLRTLAFSIKARPGQELVCTECVTSVQKAGVRIALWLLDSSVASITDCLTSWQHLTRAQDNGDVASLGIFGSSGNLNAVQKAVSLNSDPMRISVLALELSPATIFDKKSSCDQIAASLQGDKPVMLFGIYGHKNSLVQDRGVHAIAEDFDIDPCMVLLKWAEGLGCLCVAPWLRTGSDAPNGFLPPSEAVDPRAGAHSSFLADYSMLDNSRQIMHRIASLRPPDMKNNLIWFGSVCSGLGPSQTAAPTQCKYRKQSLVLPGIPDRDVDVDWVTAASTSRARRRRSTGSSQVQESASERYVRRRSAGNMSSIPSLEENMSAQQRRIRRRSADLPSVSESRFNKMLQNPSEVETKNAALIREDARTCTWPTNQNATSRKSDESAVDVTAHATEYLEVNNVVSKARTETEAPKLFGTALATPHGTTADTETLPRHQRLRRRHSTEAVGDKTCSADVPLTQHRRSLGRRRTDTFCAIESSPNGELQIPEQLASDCSDGRPSTESLKDRRGLRRIHASESSPNGELQTSVEKEQFASNSSDGRPSTEPMIKDTAKQVDDEPADVLHGSDEHHACQDEAKSEAKEESNSGTLTLLASARAPSKRRTSANRQQLLAGIYRVPTLDLEADDTPRPSTESSSRKRTLEPLPLEQHHGTTSARSNPEPRNRKESPRPLLSDNLRARRDVIVAEEGASGTAGIAGFGVSKTPSPSPGKVPLTSSSGTDAACQELTPSESAENAKPVRSRPLLPFGPQKPVAPPPQSGRRPSKF